MIDCILMIWISFFLELLILQLFSEVFLYWQTMLTSRWNFCGIIKPADTSRVYNKVKKNIFDFLGKKGVKILICQVNWVRNIFVEHEGSYRSHGQFFKCQKLVGEAPKIETSGLECQWLIYHPTYKKAKYWSPYGLTWYKA